MAQWVKDSITFSSPPQNLPANGAAVPSQNVLDFRTGSQLSVLVLITCGPTLPVSKVPIVKLQVGIDGINFGTWDKVAANFTGAGTVAECPFKDIPDGWPYYRLLFEPGDQSSNVTLAIGGWGKNYS